MKLLKHLHFCLLLIAGLFPATISLAQCDLKRYQELIKEGDAYLIRQEPDYKQAMNAYSAAMTACKDKMPEVQKKIVGLFEKVNQLKTKAEKSEQKALAQQLRTDSALTVAENEKQNAFQEKLRADSALHIAESIVHQFYFYDDKFALAVKKKHEYIDIKQCQVCMATNNLYGFIDPEGNTVIDFKYEEAFPFDMETGFAKVKLNNQYYLIDTTGTREYLLCDDPEKLNNFTVALDLRNRGLKSIPEKIYKYPQIKILLLSGNELEQLPPEQQPGATSRQQ